MNESVTVTFEDLTLSVRPDPEHDWLLSNAEAAAGMGATVDALYQLKRSRAAELVEGKHFVTLRNSQGGPERTLWTKRGIVRLGFWVRSDRAVRFRDWAEDLVIAQLENKPMPSMPDLAMEASPAALRLLTEQAQTIQILATRVEQDREKVVAFDTFLDGSGYYLIATVAKMIGLKPMRLFGFLRDEQILISKGRRRNEPYSSDRTRSWFKVKTYPQKHTNGRTVTTTYVTPYGAEQIRLLAIKRGLLEPQLLALTGGGDRQLALEHA